MQKKIITLLRRYRRALEAEQIPVAKMILYGSRARGDHHPESDIDVCVVSPILGGDRIAEGVRLSIIAHTLELLIEVIPCSVREWKHNRISPLLHEIRTTGIVIE